MECLVLIIYTQLACAHVPDLWIFSCLAPGDSKSPLSQKRGLNIKVLSFMTLVVLILTPFNALGSEVQQERFPPQPIHEIYKLAIFFSFLVCPLLHLLLLIVPLA